MRRILFGAALVFLVAGCYHATIQTGSPASSTIYKQAWASSWVYGLVPPKTVNAQER